MDYDDYIKMGETKTKAGEYEEALKAYNAAIKLEQNDPYGYYLRADVY